MAVTVSRKYQVVIPEAVRNALGIKPGTKIEVIAKGKVAYLVLVPRHGVLQRELAGKLSRKNFREKRDRSL